jgi:Fic family protein
LGEVRRRGDYEQWVRFFLQAVEESARDAVQAVGRLAALHEQNIARIADMGRAAKSAMQVFEYLESNPIIEIRRTAAALDMAFNTASSAVRRLCEAGILVQHSSGQRNRTFAYAAYLDILREGT